MPYRLDVAGSLILIDSTGAAAGVDVALIKNGTPGITMPERKTAFRYVENYEGVILTSAVDAVVAVFLSTSDVQLGWADGAAVSIPAGVKITNITAEAVPVEIVTPITLTATSVDVNNTNEAAIPTQSQKLTTITNFAPVSVGVVAAVLVSDATQKRLRIRNAHATATVAIGGLGVTLANAAIQLLPGDIWLETDAAGAAWYAISDTAATSVQIAGLK